MFSRSGRNSSQAVETDSSGSFLKNFAPRVIPLLAYTAGELSQIYAVGARSQSIDLAQRTKIFKYEI
ncbi:MAG: hypothetical protein H7242_18985 [Microbacteriaceae bacterium]|nr:hypothetical protein [Burkholderiaceae bacterium]